MMPATRRERLADPEYAAYIARVVAAAQPLTDAEVEHLRRLLPAIRDTGAHREAS